MSKAITKQILVIFILILSSRLNAQQWLGRTTGNYTGTYGLYNNASSIADSKYKYYFNFWGRGVNFYNNYLIYDAPVKLNHWANGTYDPSLQRPDGKIDFQKTWLMEDLNGKTKQFSFNQDIWGPAFMFPISRNVNMSINTRQRNSLQIFGISEPIARMANNGLDSSGGIYNGNDGLNRNTSYSNGKFGSNMQSNQELSFSFAGVLAKNDHHQLTGGATVKFIRGLGAAYVKGSGFDLAATGNNTALLSNADVQYAYTDDKSVIAPFNKPYGLFTLDSKGFGAGIDLGITYTYVADKNKYADNKYCNSNNYKSNYDIKLAAAFNDLGNVRYNQGAYRYSYSGSGNLKVPSSVLNGFNEPKQNAFDTIGKQVFEQLGVSKSAGFNNSLPAAFNFQADFRFTKHFFTGIYLNQSLKGINSTGMKSTNMLSIIPRIESRGVEFSMPLTLGENYQKFNMGAYLRVGPVFFGSDNLGGLLNVAAENQFKGADIYGGVSFGIGHCHKWWYENKVEPNRIDTVTQKDSVIKKDSLVKKDSVIRKDTVRIYKRDTVKIKVHDTVKIYKDGKTINKTIHDTLYIERTVKSKADIEKENELKDREAIILVRQRELDAREKAIKEREKGTYNENVELTKCKDQTITILTENTTLKNKVRNQEDEIIRLNKVIEDQNKNKSINDAEIVRLKNDKAKAENDAKAAARKADSLQNIYNTIVVQLNNCRKANNSINDAEIVKLKNAKAKAENDARLATKRADSLQVIYNVTIVQLENCKTNNSSKNDAEIVRNKNKAENDAKLATKRADSLQARLDVVITDLNNCRKGNNSVMQAEIVKLKIEKTKAENDAKIAAKKADSLQTELTKCKTNNSSTNDAEIVRAKTKAENDAKAAIKKADSIQVLYNTIYVQLDDCKKNSSQNDATIVKLKKAESDLAIYKAELDAAVKNNMALNAKINRRDATIDSLMTALAGCSGNSGNSEYEALLKKCNDAKSDLNAEIISLKARIAATNNSLDSMAVVAAKLKQDKALTDAQNVELKSQNTALQNKVNNLTNELNGIKVEYQMLLNQNNKCSKKLDSCMRGLLNNTDQLPPNDKGIDNGGGGGGGGPMEGSTENSSAVAFDKTFKYLGTIVEGDQAETKFTMTNTGKTAVSIVSYTSDCGCYTPVFSTDPINPGESTTINITYNSAGKSGSQDNTIQIITTAGTQALNIKSFVMDKKREAGTGTGGNTNTTEDSGNSGTGTGLGIQILKTIINASTNTSTSTSGGSTTTRSGSGSTSGGTTTRTETGSTSKSNPETSGGTSTTTTTRSGTSSTNSTTAPSTRRR